MSHQLYAETLEICHKHAGRLQWATQELKHHLPFTAESLNELTDVEIAILDQFTTRFARLQDVMGVKLFPLVLELTKEQGELETFIDKLNRLEKIGAIASVTDWLVLREMRNAFSHEYPDDPDIQAAIMNRAFTFSEKLIEMLNKIEIFSARFVSSSGSESIL